VPRAIGRPAEVLREGSGIRVDAARAGGLTTSTHIIRMPEIPSMSYGQNTCLVAALNRKSLLCAR
jgi:hypothetical protein